MDVSPRALRAVTFRVALRGYNVDDVDQFLERVAEGVAALQAKLDDALSRAERADAERQAATGGEDAVQRTLVLAQRTADLAIKEAKEEAARLVADARQTAERLAEEAQRQLRADLERLEGSRKQLHADVLAMQQYVENERTRVRTMLAELVRKVDSTARRPAPPPTPSTLDIPPAPDGDAYDIESDAEADIGPVEPPRPSAFEPAPVESIEHIEPEPSPFDTAERHGSDEGREPGPPPVRERREPQPPPVTGTPFAVSRPAQPRPEGPPPGPHRLAAASDSEGRDDDRAADTNEHIGLRRLLDR
jgi:DivIVA domain-containing protein